MFGLKSWTQHYTLLTWFTIFRVCIPTSMPKTMVGMNLVLFRVAQEGFKKVSWGKYYITKFAFEYVIKKMSSYIQTCD